MEQDFTEQQKLPNGVISLVLAILSLIGCCLYGLPGLILSIIALVLANRDLKLYRGNPEIYTNYNQVKASKVIAIIGLVLSIIWLLTIIGVFAYYDFDAETMRDAAEKFQEQYERQQELSQ